jgi:uncharacterized protein YacL (UPF0231 family)
VEHESFALKKRRVNKKVDELIKKIEGEQNNYQKTGKKLVKFIEKQNLTIAALQESWDKKDLLKQLINSYTPRLFSIEIQENLTKTNFFLTLARIRMPKY